MNEANGTRRSIFDNRNPLGGPKNTAPTFMGRRNRYVDYNNSGGANSTNNNYSSTNTFKIKTNTVNNKHTI